MRNQRWSPLWLGIAVLSATLLPGGAWCQSAPADVQSLSVEVGVDYAGGDYRSFAPKKPDANECRAACAGEAQCQAYTFLRPVAGNPTGTCFLKSTVPTASKNACCISGRRFGQTQAGQLPYDEFRPNGNAPQPPAPPIAGGGLLGRLAPAIRPGILAAPNQPPQGTPPGQAQAQVQPYDEFREQGSNPPSPPPPSQPPALTLPDLLGPLARQGILVLPGQPNAPPAAPVPPPAAPAPPPTLAAPAPPPTPPAPIPSPPTPAPPMPPLAVPATPPTLTAPVPPLAVPTTPMTPAAPPSAVAQPPQMVAPGQLAAPALVPPVAVPAPMIPAPAPSVVAPLALPTDLTIAFVDLPKRVMTGGSIGADARVVARNAGGGTVAGNSQGRPGYVIDVLLSGASGAEQGQAVYGLLPEKERLPTEDLGPRASKLFDIGHLKIPADIVPGRYEVCAIIDFDETVAESNEANNAACQPVEVASQSPPASPAPGASFAQPQSSGPGIGQAVTPTLPVPRPELPGSTPQLNGVIEHGDLLFRDGFPAPFQSAELFLPGALSAREVAYQVVDGVALMEGDIVLGDPATLTERFQAPPPAARIELPPECDGDVCRRVDPLIASNRPEHLWPGGVIPYTISDRFNAGERGTIMAGINLLNGAGTPLQLVPLAGQADYIDFEKGDGCSSPVGRQGGRQVVTVDAGDPAVGGFKCWAGQVMHEVLHAAGVWHEQSRRDRNSFVQIAWDNIQDGKEHNFDQHLDDGMDIGPYDIDSIMHYGPTAFGKTDADGNKLTTIRRIDGTPFVANRNGLSPGDVAAVNQLYASAGSALPPLNQTRILTATIDRLDALSEDACNEKMDFFAEMEIGGGWGWGRGDGGGLHRTGVVEGNHIVPGWQHQGSIPSGETRAKVYIRIMDDDDLVCGGGDDEVDVSPEPGRGHLALDVNLNTGSIHLGEATRWNRLGAIGDQLVLSGANGVENGAIQFTLQIR